MRVRLLPTAALGLAVALAAQNARAQDDNIDAERFKPAVTHDGWVTAEGSAVRPTQDPFELGAFLNYAYRPLVIVDDSGDVASTIVGGRMGFDLIASYTLARP